MTPPRPNRRRPPGGRLRAADQREQERGRGRRRALPLAREGLPFVLAPLLAFAGATAWAVADGGAGGIAASALAGAGTLFVAYFFRDPERRAPTDDGLVVSPADGKVLGVGPADQRSRAPARTEPAAEPPGRGAQARLSAPAGAPAPGGSERRAVTRIAIFLSIFDVHVQRAPLAGSVRWRRYEKGSFKAAWREDAGTRNERASLGVVTERGPMVVRQVAGWAARRIVTYAQEGDRLAKGERIGLIRFGSRVELDIPLDWKVSVQAGDRVRAGETVVAQAPPADAPASAP